MSFQDILLTVRRDVQTAAMWPAHRQLARDKRDQRAVFEALVPRVGPLYQKLRAYDIGRYTTPGWVRFNAKLERALLPTPLFAFLRNPTIMYTMFVTAGGRPLATELAHLERWVPPERLQMLLAEDYVGAPVLLNARYRTSHNTIHHLYHLAKFVDRTGHRLETVDTVVEWGGGYGNLAKLFLRWHTGRPTYLIIDTPLLSCLQWLYLATILGEDRVVLLDTPGAALRPGLVNLIPVSLVETVSVAADLFISTWALNESSAYAQDVVIGRDWFGARRLLLAYHERYAGLPDAERAVTAAKARGALIEDIPFLPGNHYAFL